MMAFLNTIAGRTILVLMLAMGTLHIISLWAYQGALDAEIASNDDTRLAERLLAIRRSVSRVPLPEREPTAHALAGGPFDVHWSQAAHAIPGGSSMRRLLTLRDRLLTLDPELDPSDIVTGSSKALPDDPHVGMVSLRLPDTSWVNVGMVAVQGSPMSHHGTLFSTSLMTGGLAIFAIFLVRHLTRPLMVFAEAARQFSTGAVVSEIAETGPTEIRTVASALNIMQVRIKRLLDDRTQTLAAISHDLKTPLTRLRFRAEDVADDRAREDMVADIDEMEAMIQGTLAFLKGDRTDEPVRRVDLATLVETVVSDFSDMGRQVAFSARAPVIMAGRKLALKRAVTNVIENAVKYGGEADIAVASMAGRACVTVTDRGPGIADEAKEIVFAPFHRLEASRNKGSGGVGLGLTVARTIVRGHGGEVILTDAPGGGLTVTIDLPVGAVS
jgi:two-component system, OmpR family, sensor kinase